MPATDREAKQNELDALRARVNQLEAELRTPPPHWQAGGFYTAYYATAGFILGMFGAMTSLLLNVIGSALVERHPLQLIQIYLTCPLGAQALEMGGGLALTIGCCLYLATGMVLGVPFFLLLRWFAKDSSPSYRFILASVLALSMWVVHFYLILSWLQPLLFGGNWIVEQIPWQVGALTHLVYGWTMAIVYPLGRYEPYRRHTDTSMEES